MRCSLTTTGGKGRYYQITNFEFLDIFAHLSDDTNDFVAKDEIKRRRLMTAIPVKIGALTYQSDNKDQTHRKVQTDVP
jgi:hypothetical protein